MMEEWVVAGEGENVGGGREDVLGMNVGGVVCKLMQSIHSGNKFS